METIIIPRIVHRSFVTSHPNWLFLYGHDVFDKGFFGHSEIAHEPNTIAIPTMIKFCASGARYFTDQDSSCKKYIDEAFNNILTDTDVIIPLRKMGEGCSRMKELSPRLHAYLRECLDKLQYPNIKWDYKI